MRDFFRRMKILFVAGLIILIFYCILIVAGKVTGA